MASSDSRPDSGKLFVVATPIGNLDDATFRSIETLKSVDAIAAEDTRRTRKLLSHFGIRTPLMAYHDHNEERASREMAYRIEGGDSVALVSDAGTPLVADPGYRLVRECADRGIDIVAVPGASSAVAALSVAGLPPQPFHFAGYLPRKRGPRKRRLAELDLLGCTVVLFESPHRIASSMADMLEVLGDRRAVIVRELTKVHEEIIRGPLSALASAAEERTLKGEIVVLFEGRDGPAASPDSD